MSATVAGNSPTGDVQFLNGSAILGDASLNGSQATFTFNMSQAGAINITAIYLGDSGNAESTSNVITLTVNTGSSATALSSSVNPAAVNQTTVLTATVTPAAATGIVTFADGSTTLGSASLSSGVADF